MNEPCLFVFLLFFDFSRQSEKDDAQVIPIDRDEITRHTGKGEMGLSKTRLDFQTLFFQSNDQKELVEFVRFSRSIGHIQTTNYDLYKFIIVNLTYTTAASAFFLVPLFLNYLKVSNKIVGSFYVISGDSVCPSFSFSVI